MKRIFYYLIKLIRRKSDGIYFNKFLNTFSFDRKIKEEYFKKLHSESINLSTDSVDKYIRKSQCEIDKVFFDEITLITQTTIKKSKLQFLHGKLLYTAVMNLVKNNNVNYYNILEIGTARGFSSLCMAKALHRSKVSGKIITIDPLPHNHKMYWGVISDQKGKLTRRNLLNKYDNLLDYIFFLQAESPYDLDKVGLNRINFCFIDGVHNYFNAINEAKYVEKFQKKGDQIFFDDYNNILFKDLVIAINEFCEKFNYSKFLIKGTDNRDFIIATKN